MTRSLGSGSFFRVRMSRGAPDRRLDQPHSGWSNCDSSGNGRSLM